MSLLHGSFQLLDHALDLGQLFFELVDLIAELLSFRLLLPRGGFVLLVRQDARRSSEDYLASRVDADDSAPAGGLLTRLSVEGAEGGAPQDRVTLALQLALAGYLVSRAGRKK